MIGGTVGVITAMSFFTGVEVGMQGHSALEQLGTSAFAGFFSAYFNTREIAPLVAGIALAATVGCGFTAQLGAMRISEEVDALEVMAIPSLPYLVTTRVIAGMIAIVPLYMVGLFMSYFATKFTVTVDLRPEQRNVRPLLPALPPSRRTCCGRSSRCSCSPSLVILIHCYYGYYASGGPVGVGVAVGRAIRTSIVVINVVDLMMSMAIWGTTTTVRLAG